MDGFLVFGTINLVIAVVAYKFLDRHVDDPECGSEVHDVSNNKKVIKVYFTIAAIMTVVGLIGALSGL